MSPSPTPLSSALVAASVFGFFASSVSSRNSATAVATRLLSVAVPGQDSDTVVQSV